MQAWHERKSGRKIRKNIYVLHNLLTPNTLASHNSALMKIWCWTQTLSEEKAREAFPNPKLTPGRELTVISEYSAVMYSLN